MSTRCRSSASSPSSSLSKFSSSAMHTPSPCSSLPPPSPSTTPSTQRKRTSQYSPSWCSSSPIASTPSSSKSIASSLAVLSLSPFSLPSSSSFSSSSSSSSLSLSWWGFAFLVLMLLSSAQVMPATAEAAVGQGGGLGVGGGKVGDIGGSLQSRGKKELDAGTNRLGDSNNNNKVIGDGLPVARKINDGKVGSRSGAKANKENPSNGQGAQGLRQQLQDHETKYNKVQEEMRLRETQRQQQQVLLDEQQQQQRRVQQLQRLKDTRAREAANAEDLRKETEKEQNWVNEIKRKVEKTKRRQLPVKTHQNTVNNDNTKANGNLVLGLYKPKAAANNVADPNNGVGQDGAANKVVDQPDHGQQLARKDDPLRDKDPMVKVADTREAVRIQTLHDTAQATAKLVTPVPVVVRAGAAQGVRDSGSNRGENRAKDNTRPDWDEDNRKRREKAADVKDNIFDNRGAGLDNTQNKRKNLLNEFDKPDRNTNNNNDDNNNNNDNIFNKNSVKRKDDRDNVDNDFQLPSKGNVDTRNADSGNAYNVNRLNNDNNDNNNNKDYVNQNNNIFNNNNNDNNNNNGDNNHHLRMEVPAMGGININWDWEDFSIMFDNYGAAEMKVRRAPHPTTGEPWPLPQYYAKKENKVYKISKELRFVPTGHTCDILEEGMARHLQRVLRGSVEDMYDNLQNAEGTNIDDPTLRYEKEEFLQAPTISRVELRLRKACVKYPSLEMDESYDLVVKKKKTFIYANEIWGVLRGLETLGQLVWRGSDGVLYIKDTVVSDYPRFPHRGLHIDTSRHYLFKEVLLDIMDSMEMNKLNVFHWHIVDDQSFPYESKVYPELSRKGAYHPSYVYTLEDIAELVEYGRMRGIRVMPEFDTPGHTYSWGLSRPELLTQCYSGSVPVKGYLGPLDPSKNSTYRFLSSLFQEVMDVFKDQFLHLGGDEVPLGCWQSNSEVMAFANELTRKHQDMMAKQPNQGQQQQQQQQGNYNNYGGGGAWSMWSDEIKRVYEYYENRLIKLLNEIGRKRKTGVRYIMWQEVMNQNLQLPNDTIIQVWMGDMGDVMRATSMGYQVLYSTCWYLDHLEYGTKWPKYYQCDPVDQSYGYHIDEKKVLGGEAAFWSEYFSNENLIPMMWPRASAAAERLWSNKEVKNLDKAGARLSEHRCRMIKRGINAGEISGPGYCLHSPPKRRLFNETIGCKGANCSRQHNFVEIEDIQVHLSQRGGGLADCGSVFSRADTGIILLLFVTCLLVLITWSRSSSRLGRMRHCKNRAILLIFMLLLLIYFLCYTTIGLRAFEFSGSIHKTFQEDKRGQSKDGMPSFQNQKRLLS